MTARDELYRRAAGTVLIAFDGTTAPSWLLRALEQDGYAGVVLFGNNIDNDAQTASLVRQLADCVPDLVVSLDEEGGDVTRLGYLRGSLYPGNAALGRVDDVRLTREVYEAIGADLNALGITLDFAPSADINTALDNPVIGTRSFGADPDLVTRHTVAAVQGLQRSGVAACVKHYPGHGATTVDSHVGIPLVDAPLEVLRARDLAPFVAAVRAGVAAVMTAHVRAPALTGNDVATTSRPALTDMLRGQLGFAGVIVTDSLEMAAIRDTFGMAEGAVLALSAGADLLCTGGELRGLETVEPMVDAIVRAVREGRLGEDRLADARDRVAALRRPVRPAPAVRIRGGSVGLVAARRAVRLLAGSPGALSRPLVIELQAPPGLAVGTVPWGLATMLADILPGTEQRAIAEHEADAHALVAAAYGRSIIVVTRDAHRFTWQRDLIDRLTGLRTDVVVVEMGLPVWRPVQAAAYVATYGAGRSNAHAAAELLAQLASTPQDAAAGG